MRSSGARPHARAALPALQWWDCHAFIGPYAGGTEYDEGRPYISAIDGPGGPIITGDHLTRDRATSPLII